ncbi:MAG: zinc ribbon domain-containing protein [Haloferacaceae archaeon]
MNMVIQPTKLLAAAMAAVPLAALVVYAVEWHLLPLVRRYVAVPARLLDAADAGPVDPDAGVVRCPDCGTANDLGYRFCRACVAELPGAVRAGRPASTTLGRASR